MNTLYPALSSANSVVSKPECPLNSGLFILDHLLASLGTNRDSAGLDAALDLRLALAEKADAATVLSIFFRVRAVVEESHYLACYRLRRWLDSHYVAHVQLDRAQPAVTVPFQLAVANDLSELRTRCIAAAGGAESAEFAARVRFGPAEHVRG